MITKAPPKNCSRKKGINYCVIILPKPLYIQGYSKPFKDL